MGMAQPQPGMVDLDGRDRDVLRTLADGRANPKLIREETSLDKGDTNTVLVRLGRLGYVRQVERGLYELTAEGYDELGITPPSAIDAGDLQHALDELEAALERGDRDRAERALGQARDALEEDDAQ